MLDMLHKYALSSPPSKFHHSFRTPAMHYYPKQMSIKTYLSPMPEPLASNLPLMTDRTNGSDLRARLLALPDPTPLLLHSDNILLARALIICPNLNY
jgi:hypothetical protein